MEQSLSLRVLLVKILAVVFSVGSGLNLGSQGCFIHISCCLVWGLMTLVPAPEDIDNWRVVMLSAATAAGTEMKPSLVEF
jgi:H+/Cl- antiporter ClcA